MPTSRTRSSRERAFTNAKASYANLSGCDIYLARARPLDLGHTKLDLDSGMMEIIRAGDDATCEACRFSVYMHDALILGNAARRSNFRYAAFAAAIFGHATENVEERHISRAQLLRSRNAAWTIPILKRSGPSFRKALRRPRPGIR